MFSNISTNCMNSERCTSSLARVQSPEHEEKLTETVLIVIFLYIFTMACDNVIHVTM